MQNANGMSAWWDLLYSFRFVGIACLCAFVRGNFFLNWIRMSVSRPLPKKNLISQTKMPIQCVLCRFLCGFDPNCCWVSSILPSCQLQSGLYSRQVFVLWFRIVRFEWKCTRRFSNLMLFSRIKCWLKHNFFNVSIKRIQFATIIIIL